MHRIADPNTRIYPYQLFGKRMKKLIEAHKSNSLNYSTYIDAMTSIYWELLMTSYLAKLPIGEFEFFNSLAGDIGLVRFGEQPEEPLTDERLKEGLNRADKLIRYYDDYGIKY